MLIKVITIIYGSILLLSCKGSSFSVYSLSVPLLFTINLIAVPLLVWINIRNEQKNLEKARKITNEKELALTLKEKSRTELENRHKEITDSINYASRIQKMLMPTEEKFKSYFQDAFVLHMPKDTLSGDFYWIAERNEKVYIAVADCTGHGVPGAMMSILGFDMLEQTIKADHIGYASDILDIINLQIINAMGHNPESELFVRDGIDMGLCIIDKVNNKLNFAGALFSLFLFRNRSLTEIKGDRFTLGMLPPGRQYRNTDIELQEDDIMYLFSDGYVDQFGGTENKKFKYRRFRHLLSVIHNFPVRDQKAILFDSINTWKGTNPQVDDILIAGFRPVLTQKIRQEVFPYALSDGLL